MFFLLMVCAEYLALVACSCLWNNHNCMRFPATLAGASIFSLLHYVQTGFRIHQASCWTRTGVFSQRQTGRSVKLTSTIYLLQKLRINDDIILLPIYAFMEWMGDIFCHTKISLIQPSKTHIPRILVQII